MSRYIPDFYFEQLLLEELPENRKHQVMESAEYEKKIADLKISNKEILNLYPPIEFVKKIEKRIEGPKLRRNIIQFPFKLIIPLAVAACLALIILSYPSIINSRTTGTSAIEEITRIKGMKPSLKVYRQTNGDTELLSNQALVEEHDLLQLSYNAGGEKYGTILSVDGRGTVTLHYPAFDSLPPVLDNEGEIALPYSYELDDAPMFEQFILITSDEEFDVAELIDLVQKQSVDLTGDQPVNLDIPDIYEQTSIYLKKGKKE